MRQEIGRQDRSANALYLKQCFLSHRLLDDYDVIAGAASTAWNMLAAEAGRLTSLSWLPWAPKPKASLNL